MTNMEVVISYTLFSGCWMEEAYKYDVTGLSIMNHHNLHELHISRIIKKLDLLLFIQFSFPVLPLASEYPIRSIWNDLN